MPHMQDPFFSSAVVFICEHNKDGAMGLIINKKFKEPNLNDLFEQLYIGDDAITSLVPDIHFGGPVMLERGIVLHGAGFNTEGTISISDEFSMTSQKTVLQELKAQDIIPYKLMLGHAGWAAEQLEREIENGDWLMQSTTLDFVFNLSTDQMWRQAAGSLGMDLGSFEGVGGQA
ncbi:MAG: YqgE/AlgH family protein [Candidatus Marinimicrobia bacterium]|nr:YqgE/AlgH family protein [Candidatus Neomarinimicrobiota bacterium]